MDFKSNLNKIHSDLVVNFDNVTVLEKSSKEFGEYVEITTVSENKELIMLLSKRDLNSNNFKWNYYSNPSKKDYLVERSSTVENIINDVKDIFLNNRFESTYINKIK